MKNKTTSLITGFISGVVMTSAAAYLLVSRRNDSFSFSKGSLESASLKKSEMEQADSRYIGFLRKQKEANLKNAPIRKPCFIGFNYCLEYGIDDYFSGLEMNDILSDKDIQRKLDKCHKLIKIEKAREKKKAIKSDFHMATPLDFEFHKICYMD